MFGVGNHITLIKGDKCLVLPEDDMMSCEVLEKKLKSGNRKNTLAIIGLGNITGKVVLVASTNYRRLSMDFITVNDIVAELWRNDCQAFGFSLDCSTMYTGDRCNESHDKYYQLFHTLPILVITTF
jgi:hypothetical protein